MPHTPTRWFSYLGIFFSFEIRVSFRVRVAVRPSRGDFYDVPVLFEQGDNVKVSISLVVKKEIAYLRYRIWFVCLLVAVIDGSLPGMKDVMDFNAPRNWFTPVSRAKRLPRLRELPLWTASFCLHTQFSVATSINICIRIISSPTRFKIQWLIYWPISYSWLGGAEQIACDVYRYLYIFFAITTLSPSISGKSRIATFKIFVSDDLGNKLTPLTNTVEAIDLLFPLRMEHKQSQ